MSGPAVAAFVKTPGLTPVKTRLAAGIGAERAAAFYDLSCRAVEEVLGALNAEPYWAVAEAGGSPHWPAFPCVWQGEGSLAERLDRVYAELIRKHNIVYLVGADCPQLSADDFAEARAALGAGADFVLGPARDGGFYLMAGAKAVPRERWLAVPMSAENTGDRMREELAKIGRVALIRQRADVDTAEDFGVVLSELKGLRAPVPTQVAVSAWLEKACARE